MKKLLGILVFSLLFTNILKADHVTKEGIFKDDPVYHNEKKIILSCRYGDGEQHKVILDINGDNATVYHVNKNEKYYFDDLELSEPNKVYKGGNQWNILWIGGYIAVELNKLTIHYGYASKKEAQKSDDIYGPCVEINKIKTEDIKKRNY